MSSEAAGAGNLERSDRPLVSVIIPAYNVAAYVEYAIESALTQTYPRVEVVVVNDGSTDSTASVIEKYRSRAVIVTKENGGVSSARNAGILASSGSIIGLLDGDDMWLPERVEKLVALLETRPELGMVTSDSYVMDNFTPTERRSYPDRRRRPFPALEEDQIPEIARFNFLFIAVLFRRELVKQLGMFTEGKRVSDLPTGRSPQDRAPRRMPPTVEGAEDYDLWIRFLLSGTRAGFVDEPLGYYRVRPGSLSQARIAQARAHQAVLERHLPALWKQGARGLSRDCYEIGSSLAERGNRGAAIKFYWHALTGEGASGTRFRLAASSVRRLLWPTRKGV